MISDPLPDGWTKEDVEAVIRRDVPDALLHVPISVSMYPPDCEWAQDVCVRLSAHPHFNVRGNAILGFGHLARVCRHLDLDLVQPIVEAALTDPHQFVRGQASSAAQDIHMYLGVVVAGYDTEQTDHFLDVVKEFLAKQRPH